MDEKTLLQQVRVSPIKLAPGKIVISKNPGEWTSPFEGKGFEPFGYRDFSMGENPRHVHLPTSARRGVPTIVERVALRDYRLMVVVDLTPSMNIRKKLATQLEVASLLLYAAWQAETTFSLAVRTEAGVRSYGAGIGSRHFYHAYQMLWALIRGCGQRSIKGRPLPFRRCLPPNAMLIVCSDFLESDGEISDIRSLLASVDRYDFIPVIIQDELESGFPTPGHDSLIPFVNPESGSREELWISAKSATEIDTLYRARFEGLVEEFNVRGIRHIHLASPGVQKIRLSVDNFFRRRKRKSLL